MLIGGRCICDSSRGLVPSSDGSTCVCPPGMELNPEGINVDIISSNLSFKISIKL